LGFRLCFHVNKGIINAIFVIELASSAEFNYQNSLNTPVMNIKFTTIIVLLAALMASCSSPNRNQEELTILDLSQDLTVKSEMTLSQIADDISYTKLESKPGCFIERIHQYSISKDYILIYERKQSQIMLFNRKGEFLRNIARSGKGPGEFFYPYDVRISRNDKFILIHFTNKVLRYGFDGKFIGETTLPGYADCVDTFDDGLVAFFTSSKSVLMDSYSIIFFDWDGNITGQLMKRNWDKKQSGSSVRRSMFYYLNNELRINEGYYDTVYAITPNRSLEPRIGIIHNYKFDPYEEHDPDEWMYRMSFKLDVWMEMPDYLFVNGAYKKMMHPMCLVKESGKIYHIPFNKELKTYGIPNDLDGGPPFWPSRYKDGKVISVQYAPRLKSVLDNELIDNADFKNQKLRDRLITFKDQLTEEDGPVLIEITLK